MSVEKEDLEMLNKKFGNTKENPDNWDKIYCAGRLFNTTKNSGARLIMSSAFQEQCININNPNFPFIYTGSENAFGRYADSITRAENTVRVIAVISKFPTLPRHIYYYVVQDVLTGVYDIIEIKHYESYAEKHGYVKKETDGDYFMPGSIIPGGKILASAPTLDENGNYRTGFNANMIYASYMDVEEDGYMMSDEFAKSVTYMEIDEVNNTVNKNIILLNLYGDNDNYKCFPDIGEYVKDGIICVNRQINYTFAASETTQDSLKRILDSDTPMYGKGRIIDIDVFINDEEELRNNACRTQLLTYWTISKIFHQKIIDELGRIVNNRHNKYTYRLQQLYEHSRDFMNPNIQFSSNNGLFEFGFIRFVVANETHLKEGSKITDRAASKGVVCHIVPKSMMPRDKWGNVADIVQCPPGIVGRANSDQTYEAEKNFVSFFVRKKMAEAAKFGVEKQFAILYDYFNYIDTEQAEALKNTFESLSEADKIEFITDNIMNGIYIRQGSTNNMSYEQLCGLYDKYKIKPDRVRVQRRLRKHGFNKNLMIDKDDSFFTLFKDKNGEIINEFISPYNADEQKKRYEEIFGENKEGWVLGNEWVVPNGNNTKKDGIRLVKETEPGKFEQVAYRKDLTIDEILDKTWTDETFIVDEDDETVTLSFLSQEPVIIASKFFQVLEHVPEGKLSARFIGSTNPLGIPNKSGKSENSQNGPYGNSPIKYGEMEVNNALIRIKPNIVFRYISEVSTNPKLRNELCKTLLYKDPLTYHNLETPMTDTCDNISAKEFEAYLFCLGLEVINDKSEDIYSAFDDRDYTDEELEKIFAEHAKLHPPKSIVEQSQ